MSLHDLSLSELEAKQERLLNALFRVRAAIQRQRGTENIEQQVARLPKKQRAFVLALLEAPNKRLECMELEEKVWNCQGKSPEYFRAFVSRIETTFVDERLPLLIEAIKRENGDVLGYKLKKLQN